MQRPLVSVIMASYNYARFLPEALESLRAQTMDEWELVVIDDASRDGSPRILLDFAASIGDRCRLTLKDRNVGLSTIYNHALDEASGKYVAFLSADDVFAPERLAVGVEALEARPELDISHSDLEVIDDGGRTLRIIRNSEIPPHLVPWFVYTRGTTPIWTPTAMVRRGEWRVTNELEVFTDVQLWLRLAAVKPSLHIPRPLVKWRQHGSNLSRNQRLGRSERRRLLKWMRSRYPMDRLFPPPLVMWGAWSLRHCAVQALAASAMSCALQGAWGEALRDGVDTSWALFLGFVLRRGVGATSDPTLRRLCRIDER